jgi:ADP-ribosylglycohydrolase
MEQAVPLSDQDKRLLRAKDSLEGLSMGDAFGQQFLLCPPGIKASRLEERILPRPSWPYTDDTQMALSLVSILRQYGSVEQDVLAESFAERYDSARGYGPAMHALLRSLRTGRPWQEVARKQFGGQGSYGNGAAIRIPKRLQERLRLGLPLRGLGACVILHVSRRERIFSTA